ncbi:hypothetical protein T492DRAFT_927114 [Pavlovales sp. CCMP2436]|nr:hypothetical protein T492DRAFT_927114 [Pavlovales sp. CCMP2436]
MGAQAVRGLPRAFDLPRRRHATENGEEVGSGSDSDADEESAHGALVAAALRRWAPSPPLSAPTAMLRVCRYHAGTCVLAGLLLPPLCLAGALLRLCARLRPGRGDSSDARTIASSGRSPPAPPLTMAEWSAALSADALAHAVCLNAPFAQAARLSHAERAAAPRALAAAQARALGLLTLSPIAAAANAGAVTALALALTVGAAPPSTSAALALLGPAGWAMVLAYALALPFSAVLGAAVRGLAAALAMDSAHNPPELRHAPPPLTRALGEAENVPHGRSLMRPRSGRSPAPQPNQNGCALVRIAEALVPPRECTHGSGVTRVDTQDGSGDAQARVPARASQVRRLLTR